jgi:hypothetical protein
MMQKRVVKIALGLAVAFVAVQLVPYGRSHDNPKVVAEPAWPSPEVRAIAVRACFDCHSHETKWPWYSHVAPVSWLVQHDVEEARTMLNLSAWNEDQPGADSIAEEINEGEMPLRKYVLLHPEAKLSDADRQRLIEALTAPKP